MTAANNMMHALAKTHAAPGIWAIQAPVPECGPDDVLIRVKRTAICGTDMHIYNWDDWAAKIIPVPMIIGHEFSGEIIEIGGAVTRKLKLGQRVSGEGHIINPHSAAARAGRFHLDPDTQGVGVNRTGAFAEFLAIPAFNVVPLPDAVSDDVGALLDPFGNAVHTAQQFDLLGEDVLVAGAGPIGIMAAAVARKAGARRVIITDINPYRLALAGRFTDCRAVHGLPAGECCPRGCSRRDGGRRHCRWLWRGAGDFRGAGGVRHGSRCAEDGRQIVDARHSVRPGACQLVNGHPESDHHPGRLWP